MRVCFVPGDWDGGGFYRCLFPMRELQTFGIEAGTPPREFMVGPAGQRVVRLHGLPDAAVYVLHHLREAHWPGLIADLRRSGRSVVVDFDDLFSSVPTYNPTRDSKLPELVSRQAAMVRAADLLTVATPALADAYGVLNRNVAVLRNYLDWNMWSGVPQQSEVEREGGRVRVGWMGACDLRMGDLSLLRGVVGPFLERHPNVDFVVSGDDAERAHNFLGVPWAQRVSYPRVLFRDLQLWRITAVMDIGLVPLADNRFNEAKSHLKGMEYAACGIPCVASPTESYRDYWFEGREGEVGVLARRPRDWLRRLEELVSDDGLRREMGRRARERAAANTIQEHGWRWKDEYERLVGAGVEAAA